MMTPRQRFLRDTEAVSRHKRLIENPDLHTAIEVAFAELCWTRLAAPDDPRESWAANAQRAGAKTFIETFLSLADQHLRPEIPQTGQLVDDHATANPRHARPAAKRKPDEVLS